MRECSTEKNEDQAEGHLRVASLAYEKALKLFADKGGFIPHPNPEFRDPVKQAQIEINTAYDSLNYAKEFGIDDDRTKELKNKILDLMGQINRALPGNNGK